MAPSVQTQYNNKDHVVTIEAPLPGYYDVITSDSFPIKMMMNSDNVSKDQLPVKVENQQQRNTKSTELNQRLREFGHISPEPVETEYHSKKSLSIFFGTLCRSITLIFALILIVTTLIGYGMD